MNRCTFIGRLATEPQLKQTPKGVAVCTFVLAVDRPRRKNEESSADFISVVAWNTKADFVAGHLHKGSKIALESSARSRHYDKNGQTHYVTEFYVDNVELLVAAGTSTSNNKQSQPYPKSFEPDGFEDVYEDDLPWNT